MATNQIMQHNKDDISPVDTMMLIDYDAGQPSSSSSLLEQTKILEEKRIQKYRIALIVSLFLLFVCVIILLAIFLHQTRYRRAFHSSISSQLPVCNYMNNTSISDRKWRSLAIKRTSFGRLSIDYRP